MEKLKKTEFIILVFLWIASTITFSLAILNGFELFNSDYLGIYGLLIVTMISLSKPEKALESILILLFLGLFNLLSFVYFFNVVLTFGVSIWLTPGIQLFSLVLLSILVIRKKEQVARLYYLNLGSTEEDKEQTKFSNRQKFKERFGNLSDQEIDSRLKGDLVKEAKEALAEIREERKNNL